MNVGAPGRTRTCNLLFRRCLSLDAVPERAVPGRPRPWGESYPLAAAVVLTRTTAGRPGRPDSRPDLVPGCHRILSCGRERPPATARDEASRPGSRGGA